MFRSRALLLLTVLCIACGPPKSEVADYSQFKTLERSAIVLSGADVFGSAEQISSGSKSITVESAIRVFLVDDSLANGGTTYRRIVLGDSSGYVASDLLLRNANLGVVDGALLGPVMITTEPQLGFSGVEIKDWSLVPVMDVADYSVKIIYVKDGKPVVGYLEPASVTTNELPLAFYQAWQEANRLKEAGQSGSMDALSKDPKYNMLWSHKKLFNQDEENGTYTSFAEVGWTDANQAEVQAPASVGGYFLFTDGTESKQNNLGGELVFNGNLFIDGKDRHITMFRVVVVPNVQSDFAVTVAAIDTSSPDEQPRMVSRTFANAQPGKVYSLIVFDSMSLYCRTISVSVNSKTGLSTTQNIQAECGE